MFGALWHSHKYNHEIPESNYKANLITKVLTHIFEYCIHYANLTDLMTRNMAWTNDHQSSQFSCRPPRIKHSLLFQYQKFPHFVCCVHVWHVFYASIRLSSFLMFLSKYWRVRNALYLLTYLLKLARWFYWMSKVWTSINLITKSK